MLKKILSKSTSTVKLLDEFDKSDEEELILEKILYLEENREKKWYYLSLYISHANIITNQKYISSRITMSNLKEVTGTLVSLNDIVEMHSLTYSTVPKMSLPIYHFFFDKKEIFLNSMHTMEQNKQDFSGKILFDPAVVLNAQNSKNRSGYGNEYYRDELIYEGTLYGETTEYVITGFDLVKI